MPYCCGGGLCLLYLYESVRFFELYCEFAYYEGNSRVQLGLYSGFHIQTITVGSWTSLYMKTVSHSVICAPLVLHAPAAPVSDTTRGKTIRDYRGQTRNLVVAY